MKKYVLFLFVFVFSLFAFNVNFTNAFTDCSATDLYSATTGQPCSTVLPPLPPVSIEGCSSNDAFSSVSGKPCPVTTPPIISESYSSLQQKAVALIETLFQRDLVVGSRGSDVKAFQRILKDNSFLTGAVDGVFGPITENAVEDYQKYNGLTETGEIDLSTLEAIKDMPWPNLCPFTNANNANEIDHACPPIVPLPPVKECPMVYSNEGFVRACPPVVISGVSGPQSLGIDQEGTWTVTASGSNGGDLSYSVNWGDQTIPLYSNLGSVRPVLQQDATFTHSYTDEGSYKPVFTVIDSKGRTAQTSLSVNVGGVSTQSLVINTTSLPNGSIGSNYSAEISASGGTDSYSWEVSSGSLPKGLSLVTASCFAYPCQAPANIIGIPITASIGTFEITLTSGSYVVSKTFTISITSGTNHIPTISSLSPSFGVVESQVTIHGTGFNKNSCTFYPCVNLSSPNNINFGANVIQNVYSPEGTTLTFTVPTYTTPACIYSNPPCSVAQLQITPGTYPVSVTNSSGTSNAVDFEVVAGFR